MVEKVMVVREASEPLNYSRMLMPLTGNVDAERQKLGVVQTYTDLCDDLPLRFGKQG